MTHAFTSGGTYTITVTVSNLVSTNSATLEVTVEEPVSGTTISHPIVVKANTTVTMTASIDSGGPGELYFWKVCILYILIYALCCGSYSHTYFWVSYGSDFHCICSKQYLTLGGTRSKFIQCWNILVGIRIYSSLQLHSLCQGGK